MRRTTTTVYLFPEEYDAVKKRITELGHRSFSEHVRLLLAEDIRRGGGEVPAEFSKPLTDDAPPEGS